MGLGTECGRNFCAEIGPLQLGVVLVRLNNYSSSYDPVILFSQLHDGYSNRIDAMPRKIIHLNGVN